MTIEADGHANATTPMPKEKPPTQVAGVTGIAAIPIVVGSGATGEQVIDWDHILSLPPFQMYACEKEPKLLSAFANSQRHAERTQYPDVEDWITAINEWMYKHTPEELYESYCEWHKAKGYWPNETPYGEAI